jgi:phytoene/squalene synthetase
MSDDVARLLTEIRDQQREQIALAKAAVEHARQQAEAAMAAAERSIAHQESAIRTQQASAQLYKRVVLVGGTAIAVLIVYVLSLLSRYG